MRNLSPGRATDLAILELTGSLVEDHGEHLVVSSPLNPTYYWGNCVIVLDDADVDDADRWVAAFIDAFPKAGWVTISLPRMPVRSAGWLAHGITPTPEEELTTRALPKAAPLRQGYVVRQLLTDGDWDDVIVRGVAVSTRSGPTVTA